MSILVTCGELEFEFISRFELLPPPCVELEHLLTGWLYCLSLHMDKMNMREPNRNPRMMVEAIATSMSVKEVFPVFRREKDAYIIMITNL